MDARLILETIAAACAIRRIPHTPIEEDATILAAVLSRYGAYNLIISVDIEREVVNFRAQQLLSVPLERRIVVAQAGMNINTRLLMGAFYLDLTDGEFGFNFTFPFCDAPLTERQASICLQAVGAALANFMPVFQKLMWTDARVEDMFDIVPQAQWVKEELAAIFSGNASEPPAP